MMYKTDFKVKDFLGVMEHIREAEPKMRKIWNVSSMAKQRDEKVRDILEAEAELRKAVGLGQFTMDSKVSGGYVPRT